MVKSKEAGKEDSCAEVQDTNGTGDAQPQVDVNQATDPRSSGLNAPGGQNVPTFSPQDIADLFGLLKKIQTVGPGPYRDHVIYVPGQKNPVILRTIPVTMPVTAVSSQNTENSGSATIAEASTPQDKHGQNVPDAPNKPHDKNGNTEPPTTTQAASVSDQSGCDHPENFSAASSSVSPPVTIHDQVSLYAQQYHTQADAREQAQVQDEVTSSPIRDSAYLPPFAIRTGCGTPRTSPPPTVDNNEGDDDVNSFSSSSTDGPTIYTPQSSPELSATTPNQRRDAHLDVLLETLRQLRDRRPGSMASSTRGDMADRAGNFGATDPANNDGNFTNASGTGQVGNPTNPGNNGNCDTTDHVNIDGNSTNAGGVNTGHESKPDTTGRVNNDGHSTNAGGVNTGYENSFDTAGRVNIDGNSTNFGGVNTGYDGSFDITGRVNNTGNIADNNRAGYASDSSSGVDSDYFSAGPVGHTGHSANVSRAGHAGHSANPSRAGYAGHSANPSRAGYAGHSANTGRAGYMGYSANTGRAGNASISSGGITPGYFNAHPAAYAGRFPNTNYTGYGGNPTGGSVNPGSSNTNPVGYYNGGTDSGNGTAGRNTRYGTDLGPDNTDTGIADYGNDPTDVTYGQGLVGHYARMYGLDLAGGYVAMNYILNGIMPDDEYNYTTGVESGYIDPNNPRNATNTSIPRGGIASGYGNTNPAPHGADIGYGGNFSGNLGSGNGNTDMNPAGYGMGTGYGGNVNSPANARFASPGNTATPYAQGGLNGRGGGYAGHNWNQPGNNLGRGSVSHVGRGGYYSGTAPSAPPAFGNHRVSADIRTSLAATAWATCVSCGWALIQGHKPGCRLR